MERNGQTLIHWLVAGTAFVGTLVLAYAAFQSTFPGTFESIIGSGLGLWGTENLTWNTLSVYGAASTGISEEYSNIALLSFDRNLQDDLLQGGDIPVRVTSPSGVSVRNGFQGTDFGLQEHQLAFTLSGGYESGDDITLNITGTITGQGDVVLTEGGCIDTFDNATAGDTVNASRCDVSGEGTADGGDGSGDGVEGTAIEFTETPDGQVCAGTTYDIAATVTDEEGRLVDRPLTILDRVNDPNIGTGEYDTLESTICSEAESCTVSAQWTPESPVGYDFSAEIDIGGETYSTRTAVSAENC